MGVIMPGYQVFRFNCVRINEVPLYHEFFWKGTNLFEQSSKLISEGKQAA